jgi:hypothetical protein
MKTAAKTEPCNGYGQGPTRTSLGVQIPEGIRGAKISSLFKIM